MRRWLDRYWYHYLWRRMSVNLKAVVLLLALAAGLGYWLGHKTKTASEVTYHQLTFRKGALLSARFAPDNSTVIYSAAWGGMAPERFHCL